MNNRSWLRGWRLWALVYLALLAASHIFYKTGDTGEMPDPSKSTISLHKMSGDTALTGQPVRLTYHDLYKGEETDPPVVLILQGSPAIEELPAEFVDGLSGRARVLIPGYPGNSTTRPDIPDYSVRAYAGYMEQFLDSLDISQVHVTGYKLGGAVAAYMSHLYPGRIRSITMLSAIGVQELELMGSYPLNQAIHTIQLAGAWLLYNIVPHFGFLDDFKYSIAYFRSFYDSDLRPVRTFLKAYKKPMLILHGEDDGLVPASAAREHARIVPHSELVIYESDHELLETHGGEAARQIVDFTHRVERKIARTYADATPLQIQQAEQPFQDIDFARLEGLALFSLMLLIALFTWVNEDLACIGAGLMAARGLIDFLPAVLACLAGMVVSDIGLYLIGRWLGRPALRRVPFRWFLSEDDLEKTAHWFNARGPVIIIASRFVPGSRIPTYFSAGVIGAGFWMFTLYFLASTLIWTPVLVGLSMLVGQEVIRYFEVYQGYALPVFLGTVILLVLLAKFVFPAFTWRGRRTILSRWRRLARWQFWPPLVFYLLLVPYFGWLAIKYRSLTVFTAANPRTPEDGVIGGSRSALLELFEDSEMTVPFKLIPGDMEPGRRILEVGMFMEKKNIDYPLELKPDIEKKGKRIMLATDRPQVEKYLREADEALMVQPYVKGRAFGVFYCRYPDSEQGNILSITEKRPVSVTGDGTSTLEELILKDEYAMIMAPFHFEDHKERLYNVISKGEEYPLKDRGIYLEASELITPALTAVVNKFVKTCGEFYFGRLEIKASSADDLKAGRKLTVVEVNGVTSEPISIYDPDTSLFRAYHTLTKHWETAYRIGSICRDKYNIVPSPLSVWAKKLLTYYQGRR